MAGRERNGSYFVWLRFGLSIAGTGAVGFALAKAASLSTPYQWVLAIGLALIVAFFIVNSKWYATAAKRRRKMIDRDLPRRRSTPSAASIAPLAYQVEQLRSVLGVLGDRPTRFTGKDISLALKALEREGRLEQFEPLGVKEVGAAIRVLEDRAELVKVPGGWMTGEQKKRFPSGPLPGTP